MPALIYHLILPPFSANWEFQRYPTQDGYAGYWTTQIYFKERKGVKGLLFGDSNNNDEPTNVITGVLGEKEDTNEGQDDHVTHPSVLEEDDDVPAPTKTNNNEVASVEDDPSLSDDASLSDNEPDEEEDDDNKSAGVTYDDNKSTGVTPENEDDEF